MSESTRQRQRAQRRERFLCWLGLHDWTKWTEPEMLATQRTPVEAGWYLTEYLSQTRTCQVCGQVERRRL